ncbi:MAG: alpha/beta hydrolase [Sphingomonas sp. SCN 67-18]|nr:alpha/beta hydrolase [Sphingomonas sp. SCN 67-18]ODU19965.1 MAG: alpha/beta hydrolase [Sphingomonas sp. SCN 67-18]
MIPPIRLFALLAAIPVVQPILAAPVHAAPAHVAPSAQPTRFSVSVMGSGPDVILIPGLASSANVWNATAARLAKTHRVHVIQVAGFAGAPAGANAEGPVIAPLVAEIDAYIVANRLKAPAIIGHSMGGLIGLMLAAEHGADVGRLMVVDALPFFGMMQGPQASVENIRPQAAAMRDMILKGGQEGYAASEPQVMARLVKSRGTEADAAIKAASASDHRVVAAAMYEDLTIDMRPALPGIRVPVTMVYAWDEGSGVPQAAFDALYRGAYAPLPGAEVQRIDGAYHFIMIDQPDLFGQAVDRFLAG